MSIKLVLLDDEQHVIDLLSEYCQQLADVELLKTFNNPIDALQFVNSQAVDVVISDINMPMISGIEFAKSLTKPIKVIFITAHSEYAVNAFDLDVVDYIVKPVLLPRFIKAISKAKHAISPESNTSKESSVSSNRYVFVKDGGVKKRIMFDDILYLQAQGDYTEIHLAKGKLFILGTLSAFQQSLPETEFIRIHRSTIVNKARVDSIDKDHLYIGEKDLTIGKTYRADIDVLF
ncbi:LytR/AlgR family response regulator transcription factor [Thalassotalea ganghwensis]